MTRLYRGLALAGAVLLVLGGSAETRKLKQSSCLDGFQAFVQSVSSSGCNPSTDATCCAPLLSLGADCFSEVFQLAQGSGDQQLVDAVNTVFQSCGVSAIQPGVSSPSPPAGDQPASDAGQQCADGFNAAADICQTGTDDVCCPALGGLGSDCLAVVVSVFIDRNDTSSLSALLSTLDGCGISLGLGPAPAPAPMAAPSGQPSTPLFPGGGTTGGGTAGGSFVPPGVTLTDGSGGGSTGSSTGTGALPASGASCVDLFNQALQICIDSTSTQATCCSAVGAVGTSCLSQVGSLLTGDSLDAFNTLINACSISLSATTTGPYSLLSADSGDSTTAAAVSGAAATLAGALGGPTFRPFSRVQAER